MERDRVFTNVLQKGNSFAVTNEIMQLAARHLALKKYNARDVCSSYRYALER
jgi:hypothetical protein